MEENRPPWAPRILDGVAWVEVDGELVVLDADGHQVHVLSATGALLLPLIDGDVTVDELSEDVADVFAVSLEHAARDVESFCMQMADRRVLSAPPAGWAPRPSQERAG